jgi:hypothetical protein
MEGEKPKIEIGSLLTRKCILEKMPTTRAD